MAVERADGRIRSGESEKWKVENQKVVKRKVAKWKFGKQKFGKQKVGKQKVVNRKRANLGMANPENVISGIVFHGSQSERGATDWGPLGVAFGFDRKSRVVLAVSRAGSLMMTVWC